MHDMMYTVDLSGHDDAGNAEINRFGGLFLSVEDAADHGRQHLNDSRLAFKPSTLWVRDQRGEVVSKIAL